jgi:hypothetical protein
MPQPPFFTWTEETYAGPADVPERVRDQIKILWLKGARADEISAVFNMPSEWIYTFALAPDKNSLN